MKFLCLLLLGFAQAGDASRVESVLAQAGERTYRMTQNGQKIGTFTMKTRVDKKTASFEDEMEIAAGPEKMKVVMKETAALPTLNLLSASRTGKDMDWSVFVDDLKATMKVEGRRQKVEITGSTVGEGGVLRLVCIAEQKVQATFQADVLSMTAERLEKEHIFRCVGQEVVDVGGKKMGAFKWEEKWEWKDMVNGVPTTSRVANSYWVSAEGVLLRSSALQGLGMLIELK